MYYILGIPTSRAASIVVSDDPVTRDQFYNGNFKTERAAVVLRLAKSWFRIGSLEILTISNEIGLLRSLVDFIIKNYFPNIDLNDTGKYLAFFQEVVEQTAFMIALWQSVGFTHGVCNTDNFSILSITIDYGPFGFVEEYDPKFVPNTSDDDGRYSYEQQPDVGKFNLNKLRLALLPLLNKKQAKEAVMILNGYAEIYKFNFMKLFYSKLGFKSITSFNEDDEQFIAILLKIMEDTKADFTMTFRELSEISLETLSDLIKQDDIPEKWWTLNVLGNHDWFSNWLQVYINKLKEGEISESARQNIMLKVNPRYILRNWIAQIAIEKTEQNKFDELKFVFEVLKSPYTYNEKAEEKGFASPPPTWARKLKVSCSS
jgi:uncharacterized protein YdiU (UPF0061 family)